MTDYQKYQLQWMIDHDHPLDEMVSEMLAMQTDGEKIVFDGDVADLFSEWEYSNGFCGEIWACKKEWQDAEEKLLDQHTSDMSITVGHIIDNPTFDTEMAVKIGRWDEEKCDWIPLYDSRADDDDDEIPADLLIEKVTYMTIDDGQLVLEVNR